MPELIRRPLPSPPALATLRKYGLTADDWRSMCLRQRCICPICLQPFGERRLVVDHEHVKGFKARKRRKGKKKVNGKRIDVRLRVMPPAERRVHVRGILHAWCNGYVRAWLTLERAKSIVSYLESHEERKNGKSSAVPLAKSR